MRTLIIALAILTAFNAFAAGQNGNPPAEKYFGATFPATFILYIMDPDLIIGWNGILRGSEKKYIPEKYQKLPIVGGWYGNGIIPDKEVLIKAGIKKALVLTTGSERDAVAVNTLKELKIETIQLNGVTMQDYIDIFKTLGKEPDMKERGDELAAYAEQSLKTVSGMMKGYPENKRLKVYFAQGARGLETFCHGTYREEAIALAGGGTVHKCAERTQDIVTISFEQLMRYDPDVILIQEPAFAVKYKGDPKWKRLRAVKEGRIFQVPYEPFSWLDRPPSYMRFIGVPWLVCKMQPDRCAIDMDNETRSFMKLFFREDLTEGQLKEVLLK